MLNPSPDDVENRIEVIRNMVLPIIKEDEEEYTERCKSLTDDLQGWKYYLDVKSDDVWDMDGSYPHFGWSYIRPKYPVAVRAFAKQNGINLKLCKIREYRIKACEGTKTEDVAVFWVIEQADDKALWDFVCPKVKEKLKRSIHTMPLKDVGQELKKRKLDLPRKHLERRELLIQQFCKEHEFDERVSQMIADLKEGNDAVLGSL